MKSLLFVLVFFVFGSLHAAEPWQEPEDFRGLRWGKPFSEAKQFFPTISYDFPLMAFGPIEMYTTKPQQISDVLVVDFTLGYMNKQFSYAKMGFRADDFDKVRDIFIARYGRPHSSSKSTLRNALGASFVNTTLTWTGPSISIELNRYESATEGSAQIGKRSFAIEYERAQKKQSKEAAKGF